MALGCTGRTASFGSQVRKPKRSVVTSPSFSFLTEVHSVWMPAKKAIGRSLPRANQTGLLRGAPGRASSSEKLVNGTRQRCSTPSHLRQWGELTLRIFVTPGSVRLAGQIDGWRRHPPSGRGQSPIPSFTAGNDRRGIVGEDAGCRREIACGINQILTVFEHAPKDLTHRVLAFGLSVKIAHHSTSQRFRMRTINEPIRFLTNGLSYCFRAIRSRSGITPAGRISHRHQG